MNKLERIKVTASSSGDEFDTVTYIPVHQIDYYHEHGENSVIIVRGTPIGVKETVDDVDMLIREGMSSEDYYAYVKMNMRMEET